MFLTNIHAQTEDELLFWFDEDIWWDLPKASFRYPMDMLKTSCVWCSFVVFEAATQQPATVCLDLGTEVVHLWKHVRWLDQVVLTSLLCRVGISLNSRVFSSNGKTGKLTCAAYWMSTQLIGYKVKIRIFWVFFLTTVNCTSHWRARTRTIFLRIIHCSFLGGVYISLCTDLNYDQEIEKKLRKICLCSLEHNSNVYKLKELNSGNKVCLVFFVLVINGSGFNLWHVNVTEW